MRIVIENDDVKNVRADRDSTSNEHGREGLNVYLENTTIHFPDEDDAEKVARAILHRLGWDVVPWQPGK